MPFASYSSLSDVALKHRIRCHQSDFVVQVPAPLSEHFRSELEFTLKEVPFSRSDSAACETLIYPFLREVWKPYWESLTLWSHEPLAYDDDLCGIPDFIIGRRSELGSIVFDMPYLLIVEAKRDDFLRGWGQCLAAMRAAQKLNDQPDEALYGICTNGRAWEFGRLRGDDFTQDTRLFSLENSDELAGALHFVMLQCRDQAARTAITA